MLTACYLFKIVQAELGTTADTCPALGKIYPYPFQCFKNQRISTSFAPIEFSRYHGGRSFTFPGGWLHDYHHIIPSVHPDTVITTSGYVVVISFGANISVVARASDNSINTVKGVSEGFYAAICGLPFMIHDFVVYIHQNGLERIRNKWSCS